MLDDNGTDRSSEFETPEDPIEDTAGGDLSDDSVTSDPEASSSHSQDSSGGGGGLTVLLAVLILGILAAGAVAYKMHMDKREANRALQRAISVMPKLAGSQSQTVNQQLADIRTAVNQGRYERVISGLEGVSVPERDRSRVPQKPDGQEKPDGGEAVLGDTAEQLPEGPLPEEAYSDLPKEARPFFKSHEKIFKRFAMQCNLARKMRDKGINVDDLRQVRDAVIEAARLEQGDRVQELMKKMDGMLKQKAGGESQDRPQGDMPKQLRKPLDNFAAVVQKARNEQRDIRPAMKILEQADKAAASGNMEKARELIAKATAAAKDAPKLRPQKPKVPIQKPSEGSRPQQPKSPRVAQMLLQGFMSLVSAEEKDLTAAYQKIENAKIAIREKNQNQIKQILDKALARFKNIGQRREKFNKQAQKLLAEGAPKSQESGEEGQQTQPAEEVEQPEQGSKGQPSRLQRMKAMVTRGALQIFDRVRSLSDEEYAKHKDELAGQVFALLRGRPPQRKSRPMVQKVEIEPPETEAEKAEAEKRIRSKMRLAQEPYEKLNASGQNEAAVSRLDELFGDARNALYDERYMEAEQFVNEGLRILGLMKPASGEEAAKPGVNEMILGADEGPALNQPPSTQRSEPELKLNPAEIGSPTDTPDLGE